MNWVLYSVLKFIHAHLRRGTQKDVASLASLRRSSSLNEVKTKKRSVAREPKRTRQTPQVYKCLGSTKHRGHTDGCLMNGDGHLKCRIVKLPGVRGKLIC